MLEIGKTLMPIGIVLLQVGSLILLFALIFARESSLVKWLGTNAVLISFLATLSAIAGSLFYSNIIGFDPCVLCWWQRIFMYPQFIIFAMAVIKRRSDIFLYTLPLSVIGALIAIYQILLPYIESYGLGCGATTVSCTKLYINAFGYITIPVMSLTIFATLILLAVANRMTNSKS